MSGAMRKVAVYLGLVEDAERDDYDSAYDGEYGVDDDVEVDQRDDHEVDGYGREHQPASRAAVPAARAGGPRPGADENGRGSRGPVGAGATVAAFPDRRAGRPADAPLTAAPRETPRITTVHPRTFNDARTIGEHFRDGTPVIMNLTEIDDSDARRLVDFAAGLIFGLRGSIDRVTSKVFLLSPREVTVTAEDRARIAEGGFFNQS